MASGENDDQLGEMPQGVGGVLVALHGYGDAAATALSWGRRVAPPDWEVLAPAAPTDASGNTSWFATGPRGVDPVTIAASVQRIEALLSRLERSGIPVVLAGFSQGAALALAMAWRGTAARRVVALCGFFPEIEDPEHGVGPGSRPPVLILNTDADEQVPAFLGSDAARMFQTAGHRVDNVVVAGGHHVSAGVAGIAARFVAEVATQRPWISLGLPVERVDPAGEFTSGEAIAELARGYERLGFHAGYVTDHPAPDDRWLAGGGHHALEPVAALGAAAVATDRLKLHTNVYILPYRNPFLAAKALASLDAISGGRVIAGVAAGYVGPEFAALGADFPRRGELLEESLALLPKIWSGSSVAATGSGWEARSATSRPATYGGPPLWVGGNSSAALRRGVTLAQGWSPMPTPAGSGRGLRTTEIVDRDALELRLREARERCDAAGRLEPLTICFVPFGLSAYLADPKAGLTALADEVADLASLGVDWFPLMVPGASRSEVLDNAAALAGELGLSGG